MAFNYQVESKREILYAIDCSSVNDAKVRLLPGKKYLLNDGDIIEGVTYNASGK